MLDSLWVLSAISLLPVAVLTCAVWRLTVRLRRIRSRQVEVAARAVAEVRTGFARDLHDLVGHRLWVARLHGDTARGLSEHLPAVHAELTVVIESLRLAAVELRELAAGYRGTRFADEVAGLRAALAAAGVACVFTGPAEPDRETGDLLATVLREAVTNVLRHSAARRCEIDLRDADGLITLTVANDGVRGCTRTVMAGEGLANVRDRVAAVAGRSDVRSADGRFTLTVAVPGKLA
ncbi:sensor histidine kinase [Rhizohabitans arisaemae]|uniref:sensor histidine kinase n=1 Tax=Rhizohabitans arisaemae TaxID=2720610 RepID=UPI0024B199EC|nr:histidine kinase [Rhizohabitans arisaemae]